MQNKQTKNKKSKKNPSGVKALLYNKKAGITLIAVLSVIVAVLIVLLILDRTGILYNSGSSSELNIPAPPCSDKSVYSDESGLYEYMKLDDGTIIINACRADRQTTSLDIPSEIDGLKVTALGDNSFLMMTWITSVTVPEGVTYIGREAFAYSGVESVSLPKSLEYIQNNAFLNCVYIASVHYTGSADDWKEITIGIGNTYLQRNVITDK